MLNPFTVLSRVQTGAPIGRRLIRQAGGAIALIALLLSTSLGFPSAAQALPPGNAITDGRALLRYSLPIDNEPVRSIQAGIEDIAEALRGRRRLSSINSNLIRAERILDRADEKLLPSVRSDKQAEAETLIAGIRDDIAQLREAIDAKNKEQIWLGRAAILDKVGQLEEAMVQGFPFDIPEEYSNLPQLKGRATLEVTTTQGSLTMVVDGYNAPVTAGNFVDLVGRGFYDGLPFTRAEDFYVVQVGDPPGPDEGFIDPATGTYRAIPLEVMVQGDTEPTYGVTLEDAGRFLDQPVLPFSAYGTVAMARPGSDPNGGSSQFFFFLFEPELTPAGLNLLDGRYSVFGYVVDNKEVLDKIRPGDSIESIRVVDGLENLVQPTA
jgi:peptidylprolyl isomerase